MVDHGSWILDVKTRLLSPPPRLSPNQTAGHTVFVPLYVDGNDLWVLMSNSDSALALDLGTGAFCGAGLETGEEPWDVVARICEPETGTETDQVLRLGELDAVETTQGFSVVPCVGAIPGPDLETISEELELFALPLSALQDPHLVEDMQVTVDGKEAWIRVYHMGRRRIAGLGAQILESLTQRLYGEVVGPQES